MATTHTGRAVGTPGEMSDPCHGREWVVGCGVTGAVPCQPCCGIPVSPKQDRGAVKERGREHIWEGVSPWERCSSCLAASRHPGQGTMRVCRQLEWWGQEPEELLTVALQQTGLRMLRVSW